VPVPVQQQSTKNETSTSTGSFVIGVGLTDPHEGRTGQCEFLLFIFISAFSFFILLRSHLETVSDYEGLATHFGIYLDTVSDYTVSDYEGLAIHFDVYLDTVSDYEGLAIF
jgi:hypothetical protein